MVVAERLADLVYSGRQYLIADDRAMPHGCQQVPTAERLVSVPRHVREQLGRLRFEFCRRLAVSQQAVAFFFETPPGDDESMVRVWICTHGRRRTFAKQYAVDKQLYLYKKYFP